MLTSAIRLFTLDEDEQNEESSAAASSSISKAARSCSSF